MASHLALYRKYRPTCFAELVGQEPVAVTLSRAVEQGRVSHAYLFCGPRGTGKTSVARILARSLNCEQGPTLTPCGICVSCHGMAHGQALDVIEIDAASNNGVDNIRELQDRVGLAPVGGKHKIYIIDEVHMLSGGAFNALLKTLEEPPPRVIFILATTDPHKVLPTIISRCQRHDFSRIPNQAMVVHLRAIARKEGIVIDEDALALIARRAQGGLRDALSLLDQLAAAAGGDVITGSRASDLLGMLRIDTVEALGAAVLARDSATALLCAQQCLLSGAEHGAVVRELMRHLRDRLVLALSPEHAEALDIPTATRDRLQADINSTSPAELMWMLESLKDTDAIIRRSPQGAIWLDFGLLRICLREEFASIEALRERVTALETLVTAGRLTGTGAIASVSARAIAPPPQALAPPNTSTHAPPPSPPPAKMPANLPVSAPATAQPRSTPDFSTPVPDVAATFPVSTTPTQNEAPSPASTAATASSRVLPPHAWERIQERVRAKSVPTAALLGQQASVDHWAADGALIIRMPKPFKEQFDRQTNKRDLLNQAITAVLGPGTFARLDAVDPKASVRRTIPPEPAMPKSPSIQPLPAASQGPPAMTVSDRNLPVRDEAVTETAPSAALLTPIADAAPSAFATTTASDGGRSDSNSLPSLSPWVTTAEAATTPAPAPVDGALSQTVDGEVPSELRLVKEIFNGRIVSPM
jgi:DNA polymerase-3 subunit gamma/tau